MTDVRINFAAEPTLPDGLCLGVQGEHNAVRLVLTLPADMLTDATYHTVTVCGVESLWIEQTPNRDGAYREGDTLYVPLTADMTQQTSVDLFVTAYRQEGATVQLVNKTPPLLGLRLLRSAEKPPARIGGLAAEVKMLSDEMGKRVAVVHKLPENAPNDTVVYKLGDCFYLRQNGQWVRLPQSGVPTIRVVDVWSDLDLDAEENEIAFALNADATEDDPPEYCPPGLYAFNGSEWVFVGDDQDLMGRVCELENFAHGHTNKEAVLDRFFAVVDRPNTLSLTAPAGSFALAFRSYTGENEEAMPAGFYYKFSTSGEWRYVGDNTVGAKLTELLQKEHEHANMSRLNKLTETGSGVPRYGDLIVQTVPVDDVELLGYGSYNLYFASDLDAVHWTLTEPNHAIKLYGYAGDHSDYVLLSEVLNMSTGLPVRMLTVKLGSETYSYFSHAVGTYQAGWYDGNADACDAPALSNFGAYALEIYDSSVGDYVTYYSFSSLTGQAKEALRVLSQVLHTTEDRVDHPYTPADAVLRYNGTIEPNRKYAFRTGYDFTLTLPEMPWQAEDAQFVLYLECTSAVDVTFPAGTLFVGGVPGTGRGLHKLIGTWRPDKRCWTIGCVTAEAAT